MSHLTSNRVAVLAYHSVGDDALPAFRTWQVSAELLDEQLSAITAAGLELVSLSAALNRPNDRNVGLTFDDGFADFLAALPILRRHARSVTLYLPTAMIGGCATWLAAEGEAERPLLSWDAVRSLPDEVEIGAHSRTHAQLDLLHPSALTTEVAGSRYDIQQQIGVAPVTFAYPFGFHNRDVRGEVESAGFLSACEVGYRAHRRTGCPFAVSRLLVTPGISPEHLVDPVTSHSSQLRAALRWGRPVYRALRRRREQRK